MGRGRGRERGREKVKGRGEGEVSQTTIPLIQSSTIYTKGDLK